MFNSKARHRPGRFPALPKAAPVVWGPPVAGPPVVHQHVSPAMRRAHAPDAPVVTATDEPDGGYTVAMVVTLSPPLAPLSPWPGMIGRDAPDCRRAVAMHVTRVRHGHRVKVRS